MNEDAICHNLVRLSEAPGARLRCLPPEQLSPAEQHVQALLELAGLLHELQLQDDEPAAAQCIASLSQAHYARYDAALLALDLQRERRRLRTAWRALLQGLEGAALDTRVAAIAQRRERHAKVLSRLAFGEDWMNRRLRTQLVAYLDARHASVPDWSRPGYQQPVQSHEIVPAPTRPFLREGNGDNHLFIFRQNTAEALLGDWLREHPAAYHSGGSLHPITTPVPVPDNGNGFRSIPDGTVLGQLKPGRKARLFPEHDLCSQNLEWILPALAEEFAWAVFPWPGTGQETLLAWLSSDPGLADAWERALRRHADTHTLISRYSKFDSLPQLAGGVQLCELFHYGEAALTAAQGEPWLPWLIVKICGNSTQAWRHWTSRLQSCALLPDDSDGGLRIAYRATDREACLALWRSVNSAHSVVEAIVCGRDDPLRVLQSFNAARHSSDFDIVNFLSERHGWVYWYGDRPGVHNVMFHAQDTAITQCIIASAAGLSRFFSSGWW